MKKERIRRRTENLLVWLLFVIFAVCILWVLLTGADIYQKIVWRDQANYEKRTAVQYLTTKIHQSDQAGMLSVEMFDGLEALVLTEEIQGKTYKTRIYNYDGYIRELFAADVYEFLPEDGEKLLEADALSFTQQQDLLLATITFSDGEVQELSWALRSGKEVSDEK